MSFTVLNATKEDLVDAILLANQAEPGFAYDVGQALIDAKVEKEFPGPPWGYREPSDSEHWLVLQKYVHSRAHAMSGLRVVLSMGLHEVKEIVDVLDAGTEVSLRADSRASSSFEREPLVAQSHRLYMFGVVASVESSHVTPASHVRRLGQQDWPIG